jgi:DNA-binding LytR/AlgR family response regulator
VLRVIEILDIREEQKKPIQESFSQDEFYVKVSGKYLRIDFNKILYIEALADYVVVNTEDKRQYIVYSTLKAICEKLVHQKHPFYRLNRSYIVNTKKIEQIEDNNAIVAGKLIPIGNTYKDDFMKKLNKL